MRIALCLFKYFPYGGLQRDFIRFARTLIKTGHTVTVYTMEWQAETHTGPQPSGLDVKIIPKKYYSNHKNALYFSITLQLEFIKNQYDLIIGFNKIAGLDWYYCADSCFLAKNDEQKSKILNKLYSLTGRYKAYHLLEKSVFNNNKTKILFLSANEQYRYQQYYSLDDQRCFLLPPNIQKQRFTPITDVAIKKSLKSKLATSLNINKDYKWLLMVGSGFKTKGVDRSLKLLKYLLDNNCNNKKIYLLVVGQDNPKSYIKLAKKAQINNNVVFLAGREDIADFMAVSELLLHPAYRENTGTVLLESIIMGLPVVASGICGYANYIKQAGCGKVISEPFKQDDYNNTVYSLLNNHEELTKMSHLGLKFRDFADLYDGEQKILELIENK